VEHLDGNNWETIKSCSEIYDHRNRVSRKHQDLPIPIISKTGNAYNGMDSNRSRNEIQEYLNYLRETEELYPDLLELIDFSKNSRSLANPSSGGITESKDSSINSPANDSIEISDTSMNNQEENQSKVVGDSFIDDEGLLFASHGDYANKEESDDEF